MNNSILKVLILNSKALLEIRTQNSELFLRVKIVQG